MTGASPIAVFLFPCGISVVAGACAALTLLFIGFVFLGRAQRVEYVRAGQWRVLRSATPSSRAPAS